MNDMYLFKEYSAKDDFQDESFYENIMTYLEENQLGAEKYDNLLINKLILKYHESEKKIESLNHLNNKFLSISAHDLRIPISVIKNITELLMNANAFKNTEITLLSVIKEISEDIIKLLDDILEISVIDPQPMILNFETSDINNLVERCIAVNLSNARYKNISLNINLKNTVITKFDNTKIYQAIDCIINNAVKYSSDNAQLFVFTSQVGDNLEFIVEDEGPGINIENIDSIFTSLEDSSFFYDRCNQDNQVSLKFVKNIIEAHKGKLIIRSKSDRGSVFGFSLPIIQELITVNN
ncbi:MAG: HAMP domain-containing sensor histidine kinase [bacterium]